MTDIDYTKATVCLFDPVHVNLRTTRYALHEIGFRNIDSHSTLKEFERGLKEANPSLVVAECASPGVDVLPLIRRIRHGQVNPNPFATIILTSWIRDGVHLRRAITSGADDVIIRPFSTAFAEERIRTLIKVRKPFVVTSDYIGPDRREDSKRPSDAPVVAVPNTLRATVEGDEEALAKAESWIGEARRTVESERVRRLAMRIVVAMELNADPQTASSATADLSDVIRTARELTETLNSSGRIEAMQVAEALLEQVRAFKRPDERSTSNFKLAKELAVGAFAAYANGESIERSQDEIDKTVATLRKRLLSRDAHGGGALASATLNTAAAG
jgi:DNA-binding response OmpR family regulator|tara:strand:- start:17 stop:1006 length:990 start_codon:yes stop_codon:yes gene_type:complete